MTSTAASGSTPARPVLNLRFGFKFEDLYDRDGLMRLDHEFLRWLRAVDHGLADRLVEARAVPDAFSGKVGAELLIALSPHLQDFMAELFGIENAVAALAAHHHELAPLHACKRSFVQRKAMNRIKLEQAAALDGPALEAQLAARMGGVFTELGFAQRIAAWQQDEAAHADDLELALHYAAWAAHTPEGRARHRNGVLFKVPAKLDYQRLVPVIADDSAGFRSFSLGHLRRREGFALTDAGTDLVGALDQTSYRIWCHEQLVF